MARKIFESSPSIGHSLANVDDDLIELLVKFPNYSVYSIDFGSLISAGKTGE